MTKDEMYLDWAKHISKSSKCLRGNFGVIIVKNDMVIGTGYNGAARGVTHCTKCRRENDPPGVGYDKCLAVHAEVNGIIQAGGRQNCLGATMYIGSHNRPPSNINYNNRMGYFPCNNCGRVIINSGIEFLVQESVIGGLCRMFITNSDVNFVAPHPGNMIPTNNVDAIKFEDIIEPQKFCIPELVLSGELE